MHHEVRFRQIAVDFLDTFMEKDGSRRLAACEHVGRRGKLPIEIASASSTWIIDELHRLSGLVEAGRATACPRTLVASFVAHDGLERTEPPQFRLHRLPPRWAMW